MPSAIASIVPDASQVQLPAPVVVSPAVSRVLEPSVRDEKLQASEQPRTRIRLPASIVCSDADQTNVAQPVTADPSKTKQALADVIQQTITSPFDLPLDRTRPNWIVQPEDAVVTITAQRVALWVLVLQAAGVSVSSCLSDGEYRASNGMSFRPFDGNKKADQSFGQLRAVENDMRQVLMHLNESRAIYLEPTDAQSEVSREVA